MAMPLPLALPIFVAIGMACFSLVIVAAILFELPLAPVLALYGAFIIESIVVLYIYRSAIVKRFKNVRFSFVLFVALTVIAINYVFSLLQGGKLDGDAQFELARITMYADSRLMLGDAIFGDNGIPAAGYSFIQHALQAVAVKLFDTSAAWVWFYSHAFFKLIIWLGIGALTWAVLPLKQRSTWSYIVLALLPFLYGAEFSTPELHNKIIIAWTAVFLLGVKVWIERKDVILLYVGAVMMANTHTLNAFMAASFLGAVVLVLLVWRKTNVRQVAYVFPAIVLLVIPMAGYFYYPHGITEAGFHDGASTGVNALALRSIGPIYFGWVDFQFALWHTFVYALIFGTIFLIKHVSSKAIKFLIFALVISVFTLLYSPVVAALIGYAYILYETKNMKMRVMLFLLIGFFWLVVLNPIIVSVLHDRIPIWAFSRFDDFNVLAYSAPIVGLLVIFTFPLRASVSQKTKTIFTLSVIPYMMIVTQFMYYTGVAPVTSLDDRDSRHERLEQIHTIAEFDELKGQVVFSDSPDLPAMVPGAVQANVFSIDNEANANPAVHITQRKKCSELLRQYLRPNDLEATDITRIITDSPKNSHFAGLLAVSPNVSLLSEKGDLRVYQVKKTDGVSKGMQTVCAIPPTEK